MSMRRAAQVPGVPRGNVEAIILARAGGVGARSTGLFRQNSKLNESWPMSKFEKGNQWSRNGNGAGRPLAAVPSCAASCLKTFFADWQEGGRRQSR